MKNSRWQPWEIRLLGTALDSVVADKVGRTTASVSAKRRLLGIGQSQPPRLWTDAERALLGTSYDRLIAKQLGRKLSGVTMYRQRLGIPAYNSSRPTVRQRDEHLVQLPELMDSTPVHFGRALRRIWKDRHGKRLTVEALAALSLHSSEKIQSWLSGERPIPKAVRHHLFICVALLDPV